MNKKHIVTVILFFNILLLFASRNVEVQIFILDGERVVLSSQNNFRIDDNRRRVTVNQNTLNISISNNELSINNVSYGNNVSVSSSSPITINDIAYSGAFNLSIHRNNRIRVVNRVNLEDYVAGVIVPEIGAGSPLEALKAQAVATRTYTVRMVLDERHKADNYDLCNTTHCQVYRGLNGQTETSKSAVSATANMILIKDNTPIGAFYSSTCGGITEASGNLWNFQHTYLISKADNFCIIHDEMPNWGRRHLNWERTFTFSQLQEMFAITGINSVTINKINSSLRVDEVKISSPTREVLITGQYELRSKLELPSSLFMIKTSGNNVTFIGNGHGHGVGMCQIGAIVRAKKGQSFREILSFYFEGAEINSRYMNNFNRR